MNRHDPLSDSLNDWLEANAAGKSTPDTARPVNPDQASLRRSASQFHGLASRADRFAIAQSTLPSHWEDLMSATTPALASTGATTTGVGKSTRPAQLARRRAVTYPRMGHTSGWQLAGNIALATILVLVVATGAWRATGTPGGSDPGSIPFGGIVTQDGTPGAGSIDPDDLPAEEDCTVEPLTVDEVIAYVQNPAGEMNRLSDGNATPPAMPMLSASGGPASQDALDAAAETQKMWMACVMAESWFQVWALESPYTVSNQVMGFFPPLTGVDEARETLQRLKENGPATPSADATGPDGTILSPLGGWGMPSGVWLIDRNTANSWQSPEPANLWAGVIEYRPDGTRAYGPESIFTATNGTPVDPRVPPFRSGNTFTFVWSFSEGKWLVREIPMRG